MDDNSSMRNTNEVTTERRRINGDGSTTVVLMVRGTRRIHTNKRAQVIDKLIDDYKKGYK